MLSFILFSFGTCLILFAVVNRSVNGLNVYFFLVGVLVIVTTIFSDLLLFGAHILEIGNSSTPRITVGLCVAGLLFLIFFGFVFQKNAIVEYRLFKLTIKNEVNQILQNHHLTPSDYLVVIPCHNEAENLKVLLPKLKQVISGCPIEVYIIDDGSTDSTDKIAIPEKIHLMPLSENLGGGVAVQVGLEIAKKLKAKGVVTMDGDCQHDPIDIAKFIDQLEHGHDCVIGSRILGVADKTSVIRTLGIWFFSLLISMLVRRKITDTSSGYRAFRVDALKKISVKQFQFHTAEMIIRIAKQKLGITEIPITIKPRKHGTTKKGGNLTYGFNYFWVVISTAIFNK